MTKKLTVFVVDDDHAAAESVAALMTSLGLRYQVFNSAEDFIAVFDGSESGCLVLDIRLTGMSGLELRRTLRERDLDIPTILISGHADQETCRLALADGAVACLEKPFAGEELCSLVQSVLTQV